VRAILSAIRVIVEESRCLGVLRARETVSMKLPHRQRRSTSDWEFRHPKQDPRQEEQLPMECTFLGIRPRIPCTFEWRRLALRKGEPSAGIELEILASLMSSYPQS